MLLTDKCVSIMVGYTTSQKEIKSGKKKKLINQKYPLMLYRRPLCVKTSSIVVPIFAGDSHTVTPASLRVLILS